MENANITVLIFIVIAALPVLLPILLVDRSKRLMRGQYGLRLLAYIGAIVVVYVVMGMIGAGSALGGADSFLVGLGLSTILGMLIMVALNVFFTLWCLHRIQDCGWSKWAGLALMIPFVNLLFILTLLFIPSEDNTNPNMVAAFE